MCVCRPTSDDFEKFFLNFRWQITLTVKQKLHFKLHTVLTVYELRYSLPFVMKIKNILSHHNFAFFFVYQSTNCMSKMVSLEVVIIHSRIFMVLDFIGETRAKLRKCHTFYLRFYIATIYVRIQFVLQTS